jgi:molybdenum cofactor cytidylyltransferase
MTAGDARPAVVVLAAGRGRRFGGQKLLAPLGGRPLVRHTVERLLGASVGEVIVVIGGRDAAPMRAALAGLSARAVELDAGEELMSDSLRAGLGALPADAPAVLVALGDQPTVAPRIVDALVGEWRRTGALIVAPSYDGERGNPVLFDRRVVPELAAVPGDAGAREVVARDSARVRLVPFPFAPPPDVDTPADFATLADELTRGNDPLG